MGNKAQNLMQPHPLLDELLTKYGVKNDRQLAAALGFSQQGAICRVRSRLVPVSDGLRIRIMRRFGLSLRRIDELAPPADGE